MECRQACEIIDFDFPLSRLTLCVLCSSHFLWRWLLLCGCARRAQQELMDSVPISRLCLSAEARCRCLRAFYRRRWRPRRAHRRVDRISPLPILPIASTISRTYWSLMRPGASCPCDGLRSSSVLASTGFRSQRLLHLSRRVSRCPVSVLRVG